jgi:hypothetical protein
MKTFISGIIAIVVIIGLIHLARDNGTGGSVTNATTTQNSTVTEDLIVKEYVRQNISGLSTTKEQLGGTFLVTSIDTYNGTGTVSYEDGHNAYTADFTYDMTATGTPVIKTFMVR